MNEKTKNYLGWVAMLGVLALGYSALVYVGAYRRSQESMSRSFMVAGEGRAIAVPDIARFTFSVVTEGGSDLAGLQADNTAKVNQAIEFLKEQGLPPADIKTESYNVAPRYQNESCSRYYGNNQPCPPPTIVGYTIDQAVAVKIRDFDLIGPLLAGVVQNGANRVWGFDFAVDDRTRYENDARAEAIAKAQQKAEAVAEAGGFKLGTLLSIDEGFYPVYYGKAESYAMGLGGDGAMSPTPVVEPGSSEIIVTVNLRYAIK